MIKTFFPERILAFSPGFVGAGQLLIVIQVIALFFSPPIVNLSEFLVYLIVLFVPQVRSKVKEFLVTSVGKTFLSFLAVILAGAIWSWLQDALDFGVLISWRKILLLPICAALFKYNFGAQRSFVAIYLIVCTFAALLSLFKFGLVGDGSVVRNYSTQSMFFSAGAMSAVALAFFDKEGNSRSFHLCTFLVILGGLVIGTVGRSGYLASIVMLLSLCALSLFRTQNTKETRYVIIAGVILVIGLVVAPQANKRIEQALTELRAPTSDSTQTSLGARKLFWVRTVEMVPDYWIVGSGTGSFAAAYALHATKNYPNGNLLLTGDPHNQFLKIIIEQGIIGFLLFIALLFLLSKNDVNFLFWALGVSGLIGWLASSFFNSHFTTFSEGRFIWIWIGVLLTSKATFAQNFYKECDQKPYKPTDQK